MRSEMSLTSCEFRRALLALVTLLIPACGNGGQAMPDAMPDADPNAGTPRGSWRLVREVIDMGGSISTIGDTDTPLPAPGGGTGQFRVNGTLQVTDTELAAMTVNIQDDGLPFPGFAGLLTAQAPYSTPAGGSVFNVSGQAIAALPFTLAAGPPEELSVQPTSEVTLVFQRYNHVAAQTLTVRGKVSAPEALPSGRVALAFLVRSGAQVSFSADSRDDAELAFAGATATFQLDRTEGALGTERVPYGTAGVALGLVVVYEDRDADAKLGRLFDSDCQVAGQDCVRGVSPILLGYRDGVSPELAASPYAFLFAGWSPAQLVSDSRGGTARAGVTSLDPTTEAVPFDVEVPADPATVVLPGLEL
jgi:hypothetical protein